MRKPQIVTSIALSSVLAISVFGTISPLASAETISFYSEISGQVKKPTGCPDGAFVCGEGKIKDFGKVKFLYYLTGGVPISNQCVDYTAIAIFTLADGSRLVLDESGTACGPGNSFFTTPPSSWGNPTEVDGTWTVLEATGQFGGMTGSGTNTALSTGARLDAVYQGTLVS